MTKVKVYDLDGKAGKEVDLPFVFSTRYRPDVIQRAVLVSQACKRQKYGANVLAGRRTSAHYHGRRSVRYTMMNREMARISRIHGNVGNLAFTARQVPQAVKGRRAHPPKADKNWDLKINNRELELALKSALAACANEELVKARGHKSLSPIVFVNDFAELSKTKEVSDVLIKAGLEKELERAKEKKVRAGKGKTRGRRYKRKKGPLIVLNGESALKAAKNIAGVDVCMPNELDIELLAPGADAGRVLVTTIDSLDAIQRVFDVVNDKDVRKVAKKVKPKKKIVKE